MHPHQWLFSLLMVYVHPFPAGRVDGDIDHFLLRNLQGPLRPTVIRKLRDLAEVYVINPKKEQTDKKIFLKQPRLCGVGEHNKGPKKHYRRDIKISVAVSRRIKKPGLVFEYIQSAGQNHQPGDQDKQAELFFSFIKTGTPKNHDNRYACQEKQSENIRCMGHGPAKKQV